MSATSTTTGTGIHTGTIPRLVASEWLTLRSRRLVRLLTLVVVLGILAGVSIFSSVQILDASMHLQEVLLVTAFFVMVYGLILGASLLGAPWGAGTVATILSWEPRRTRVLLVRLAVTGVAVFVLACGLQALLAVLVASVARSKDMLVVTEGTVGTALRIAVTAAAISVMAGAVATVGRNTVAALAASFVYLAIIEAVIRAFVSASQPYLLGNSIAVFVQGEPLSRFPGDPLASLTPGRAMVTIAAFVAVLVLVAIAALRTRDVT